jgi:hypothetical protein
MNAKFLLGPRRVVFIRAALVLAWIVLGTALFITGRGHSLLVDNKDTAELPAPDLITVFIDGGPGFDYFRGDRDRISITGSRHRIRIEFGDGSPAFEREFVLSIKNDMYVLSIPKMLHGGESFVDVFHTAPEPARGGEMEEENLFGESLDDPLVFSEGAP